MSYSDFSGKIKKPLEKMFFDHQATLEKYHQH